MEKFTKHTVYQNQHYIIPDFKTESKLPEKQPKILAVVLTESDLQSPPIETLKQYLGNESFVKGLKSSQTQTVFGFGENQAEKYVLLYVKDLKQKAAFEIGRTHQKTLLSQFKNVSQSVDLLLPSSVSQEYSNEYFYGMIIQNFTWQFKSHEESKVESNKSLNIPILNYTIYSESFKTEDPTFKEFLIIASARLLSKELANTRANIATTDYMLDEAKKIAEANKETVELFYLKGDQVKENGLTLMAAVGEGSYQPPILSCLHYKGDSANPDKTIALVGKGVVFDSGGLNLKKAGMDRMFGDKGGACSVLGIFKGIVELGLKINVVCTMALVENSISSTAYRPSDIWTTLKGLTVEIINTDAEGRNILADAMTYTQIKYKPYYLIDMATLTGACPQALGRSVQGLFTNDDELAQKIMKYSRDHQEEVWHLPITKYMREQMLSDQADLRNAGRAPFGGSGQAAAFLEHFIEEGVKWSHFDIAPSNGLLGDGQPIRTLINFIKDNYQN